MYIDIMETGTGYVFDNKPQVKDEKELLLSCVEFFPDISILTQERLTDGERIVKNFC